ncbi:winged helix-turn-helix domain-containing protein [Nocardiopsis kunsanensis]|uniref:Winged helix DNA-binding domain-containing protein n=1 Tax=Nocardiopsis kunsanensis TaxID=141693 RepID=A0A918X7N1_9ACTN|nr:transcriptional regulator [Nocardiopsis kunsanensis]GHD17129.1 hypothetical protein GCM10007147_05960 [Nocardiopsis kunsanensis]
MDLRAQEFNDFIHTRPRLSIFSLLAPAEWVEFSFVRDHAGLSDSALSKHISAMETAGYAEVRKGTEAKRRRTWVRLTDRGRASLDSHLGALEQIIAESRGRTDTDVVPLNREEGEEP